ncbi:MAG: hypothetical protein SCH98_06685 [Deferrisomatales bacterium]|nr:hypothetical protein [Deferrisomatales bacterium]
MSGNRVCCTQFWLRKLHSLTGFLFLGYFLFLHVQGETVYGSPAFKLLFLYVPLVFHGFYGLFITYESSPNLFRYPSARNWMYVGQRATGLFLILFIPLHLGDMFGGAAYGLSSWYAALWYAGLLAAVFHLANGLFGTVIDWGITVGPHSQRVFVALSLGAFVLLSAYGLYTLSLF